MAAAGIRRAAAVENFIVNDLKMWKREAKKRRREKRKEDEKRKRKGKEDTQKKTKRSDWPDASRQETVDEDSPHQDLAGHLGIYQLS
jgi:hypothetical protein